MIKDVEIKKLVITGGAGFIGSHVFDHFRVVYPDAEILILDKMTYAADIRNIPNILSSKNARLMVGDVKNLETCLQATKNANLVLHLAAESHVDSSFDNSITFTESNTLGAHVLMEACKRNQVNRIIHISTDEVYGENIDSVFVETDPLNPTNPYSASKAGAEMIVQGYYKSFNLPVTVVRANNIYGVRQFPEKVIPKFLLLARSAKPLTIHGAGDNKRHYLAASDFARALELLVGKGQFGEAYNVGSDFEYTNLEVARLINDHFHLSEENITFVRNRPFNDSRYAVDDSKLRSLGWSPKGSLKLDLPILADWYHENSFRYE